MRQFDSFSSAIREGARVTKKGTRYTLLDSKGGACAIGAGAMAIGLPTVLDEEFGCARLPWMETLTALRNTYPYLGDFVKCPACKRRHDLLNTVADCFDVLDWTREQIADWLQGIEDELFGYETVVHYAPEEEFEPVEDVAPASNGITY